MRGIKLFLSIQMFGMLFIQQLCLAAQLKNQNEIKQDTNRIDLRIQLDQSTLISTASSDDNSNEKQPLIYIQVEIAFLKNLDSDDILEQDDLYFCLSDYLGSQCINSVNLDIYQQNFRSGLLFIQKEIPLNVFEQFVTVIVSDRMMKQEGNKMIYTVRWQTWLGKPADEELRCPFDCSMRGQCIKGVCHCNAEIIGRACEFKLQIVSNKQQKTWRASMKQKEIQWVNVESQTNIVLLDFQQGFIQIVAFSDQRSFSISSQYLLNKPQKIVLNKQYIMRMGVEDDSHDTGNNTFLPQNPDRDSKENHPLLLCFFSYQENTNFSLFVNEIKIREILDEYDKEFTQIDPESEFLSMLITILIILVILAGIALLFVYDKYKTEKQNASILQLYTSKKFGELQEDLHHEDTCRICLEKYQVDTLVRIHYKCKKVFHKSCFDKWALTGNNRKCPQCRDDYEPILIEVLQKMNQTTTELADLTNREGGDHAEGETLAVDRSQLNLSTPFVNQQDISHDVISTEQQLGSQYLSPDQLFQSNTQTDQATAASSNTNAVQSTNKKRIYNLVDDHDIRNEESDDDNEEGEDEEEEDDDESEDEEEVVVEGLSNKQPEQKLENNNEESEDEESEEEEDQNENKSKYHQANHNDEEEEEEEDDDEELDSLEDENIQIREQINTSAKKNQEQQYPSEQNGKKSSNKQGGKEYMKINNQEKNNSSNSSSIKK